MHPTGHSAAQAPHDIHCSVILSVSYTHLDVYKRQIIINSTKSADVLKEHLKGYKGSIYTINARKVSEEALGRYFPNTPMLAAIVKVSGKMCIRDSF